MSVHFVGTPSRYFLHLRVSYALCLSTLCHSAELWLCESLGIQLWPQPYIISPNCTLPLPLETPCPDNPAVNYSTACEHELRRITHKRLRRSYVMQRFPGPARCALLTYSGILWLSRGSSSGLSRPRRTSPFYHSLLPRPVRTLSILSRPSLYDWAGMSGDTIRTLPNGYAYVLVHFYSSGEAKANIVRSCV